jgi:hypothetical protein
MPEQITTTVYHYDELSDAAKAQARGWWRDDGDLDFDWWGFEDNYEIAKRLGLDIEPFDAKDHKRGIFFSGFGSQGDGACFAGRYAGTKGALAQVKDWAPQDEDLLRIAQDLDEAQASVKHGLQASITKRGNYCHEFSMDFEFWWMLPDEEQDDLPTVAAEARITEAFRAFAKWIYRQLEAEYNYLTSDEAVAETIEANGYTFTAEGKRFG